MKIAILSGAYKNAGDYLIVQRSKLLLSYVYPGCQIIEFERRKDLTPYLSEINQSDVVVFAGGPGYIPNVYPDHIPLAKNLSKILPPIFFLGLGWYGADSSLHTIKNYIFTSETKRLLNHVVKNGMKLGCRDWFSVQVLKENGIDQALMTGCPAWYDLNYIDRFDISHPISKLGDVKNICVSDPAILSNYQQVIRLIHYLKNKFVNSKIIFVFHRGYEIDSNTPSYVAYKSSQLKTYLESIGIECVDISYGAKGFEIYENCDLHIGYRVHAHIFNLSIRNTSILIEEDGRGAGVNNALNLPSLTAFKSNLSPIVKKNIKRYHSYIDKTCQNKIVNNIINNSNLISSLDDYICELFSNNFIQMNNAFLLMRSYFDVMIAHIRSIQEKL